MSHGGDCSRSRKRFRITAYAALAFTGSSARSWRSSCSERLVRARWSRRRCMGRSGVSRVIGAFAAPVLTEETVRRHSRLCPISLPWRGPPIRLRGCAGGAHSPWRDAVAWRFASGPCCLPRGGSAGEWRILLVAKCRDRAGSSPSSAWRGVADQAQTFDLNRPWACSAQPSWCSSWRLPFLRPGHRRCGFLSAMIRDLPLAATGRRLAASLRLSALIVALGALLASGRSSRSGRDPGAGSAPTCGAGCPAASREICLSVCHLLTVGRCRIRLWRPLLRQDFQARDLARVHWMLCGGLRSSAALILMHGLLAAYRRRAACWPVSRPPLRPRREPDRRLLCRRSAAF